MGKEAKILSASRIKKLGDCAWAYWCNYVLKLPSTSNSGAARGTACHLVFEVLLNKRHKHHFEKITTDNSIFNSPSIVSLIEKSLKKEFTDKNLSEVIIAVQQYREAMALFDLKLREMKGILGSYNNIKLSAQEYSGEDFEEDFLENEKQ